jgi:UDP-N-acetylenolpyruvoylglucosamine reductase
MKNKELLHALEEILGTGRVAENKDITHYTTMKSSTHAQYFFEAESYQDWEKVGTIIQKVLLPVFPLGGGSNLAIVHDTVEGLVVRNLYQEQEVLKEDDKHVQLLVASGCPVGRLVTQCIEKGWAGLEYHLGLPGTVGGAIYMNSKWMHPETYFGDNLLYAYILGKDGTVRQESRDYFHFAYDYSSLQKTKEIILGAAFNLTKESPADLKKRAHEALAYRKQTQPFGVSTSGCFFRNIPKEEQEKHHLPTTSAGYLIDHAGLKNTQLGDFIVSDKHANFIINTGHGKPEDLLSLIQMVKDKVHEKYGVHLEEEVVVV